jgi:malate dehydrogenase (quinone)
VAYCSLERLFSTWGRSLPGAPRGASTAVYTSIGVLEKCFADELTGAALLHRLTQIIPSFGFSVLRTEQV